MNITILKIIINGIGFLMMYFAWNIQSLLLGIVIIFISILVPREILTKSTKQKEDNKNVRY